MNPWTGGLTAPQWSPMTLTVMVTKTCSLLTVTPAYLRLNVTGTNGHFDLIGLAILQLQEWCLLRDYDCDGKQDIFTSYQNGIHVYRNLTEDPEFPEFELVAAPILASFDLGSGPDATRSLYKY